MDEYPCIDNFTGFYNQYYGSNKSLQFNNTLFNDCIEICKSKNSCYGFNYDWDTKTCYIISNYGIIPYRLVNAPGDNIVFYMKSFNDCYNDADNIVCQYGCVMILFCIFLIPIIVLITCCNSKKRVNRTRGIQQISTDTIPPSYEESETNHNNIEIINRSENTPLVQRNEIIVISDVGIN